MPPNILAASVLSSMSSVFVGLVLVDLLPTARTAQILAMVLFHPMLFLSGATIPREVLPESIRQIAQVLPLSHVVTLLRGLWMGDPWEKYLGEVGILAALLIVGVLVSSKTFRWE